MPDAIDIRRAEGVPNDWEQAFAQLPLEAPPADSRRRFQQALQAHARQAGAPRRDRRGTWAVGLASAAVLALVIGAPLLERATRRPPSPIAQAPVTPSPPRAADDGTAPSSASATAPAVAGDNRAGAAATVASDAPTSSELRLARRAMPGLERPFPAAQATAADRQGARVATDRLIASLALPTAAPVLAQAPDEALRQLEEQSRQLEALIALVRDDRFGTGASVAMTSELDAVIAQLDAQLRQRDLLPAQRLALSKERADALEHLAGVASTQRWLAAQGALGDAALVSVY